MKRLVSCLLLLTACVNVSDSTDALTDAGYTDVTIDGWEPLTCGKDDFYSSGFTVTNVRGKRVSGVVCCGFIVKNCTIRH